MGFTPKHFPAYRVWDPLNDTEESAREHEYHALSVPDAAHYHITQRYSKDEYNKRNFPLPLRVRDVDNNKVYDVSIDCDFEPRFSMGTPVEVVE